MSEARAREDRSNPTEGSRRSRRWLSSAENDSFGAFAPDRIAANVALVLLGGVYGLAAIFGLLGGLVGTWWAPEDGKLAALAIGLIVGLAGLTGVVFVRRASGEMRIGRRTGFGTTLVLAIPVTILGSTSLLGAGRLLLVPLVCGVGSIAYPALRLFRWGPPLIDALTDLDE